MRGPQVQRPGQDGPAPEARRSSPIADLRRRLDRAPAATSRLARARLATLGLAAWATATVTASGGCEAAKQLVGFEPGSPAAEVTTGAEPSCGGSDLEQRVRKALHEAEDDGGGDDDHSAEILGDLAVICRAEGKLDEAIAVQQRALLVWEVAVGADDPRTTRALVALGELQRDGGELEQAERAFQRALALTEARQGALHANVGTCAMALGGLYYREGRLAEAEAMYGRAIAVAQAGSDAGPSAGPGNAMELAMVRRNQALVLRRAGRIADAEAQLAQAIQAIERRVPGDDATLARLRQELRELGDLGASTPGPSPGSSSTPPEAGP